MSEIRPSFAVRECSRIVISTAICASVRTPSGPDLRAVALRRRQWAAAFEPTRPVPHCAAQLAKLA